MVPLKSDFVFWSHAEQFARQHGIAGGFRQHSVWVCVALATVVIAISVIFAGGREAGINVAEQTSTPREDRLVPQPSALDNANFVLRGLEATTPTIDPHHRADQIQREMDMLRDVREATRLRISRYERKIHRHTRLRRLIAALGTGGLPMPANAHALIPHFEVPTASLRKPMPLPQPAAITPVKSGRDFALQSYLRQIDREFARISPSHATKSKQALLTIDHALNRWSEQQIDALNAIDAALSQEINRLASVPRALGVEPQIADLTVGSEAGLGGPFVPLNGGEIGQTFKADRFDTHFERIELAVAKITRLGKLVHALPIRHPISESTPITSRYGPRRDPFTGRKAMHQGIDFRAVRGTPVLATGAGIVRKAGRQGGYGKMVVIDHGNGLTTRYGHLHRLSVSAGDTIKAGDKIGSVGSTGRSTGPHLHYEVRRDGKARNPITFISVGATL
jgi:murein DD-endopeptidase MepM/ murein hydrolase activator NlpD